MTNDKNGYFKLAYATLMLIDDTRCFSPLHIHKCTLTQMEINRMYFHCSYTTM